MALIGAWTCFAGGDGKGQDFSPLKPAVSAYARCVVLIGRDGKRTAMEFEEFMSNLWKLDSMKFRSVKP